MTSASRTPFNPRVILAVILVGFLAFLALLYFIGAGDTGDRDKNGQAHAASPGLNGFAGLARYLELDGYEVELSRSPSGLDTYNILVLTPPLNTDADEFAALLEKRQGQGPTIVVLPKWFATGFPQNMPDEIEDQVEDGWVRLLAVRSSAWTSDLPAPYTIEVEQEPSLSGDGDADDAIEVNPFEALTGAAQGPGKNWTGFGVTGQLPDERQLWVADSDVYAEMLVDEAGQALVVEIMGEQDSDFYNNAYPVLFVVEPDLLNNYGLANEANARLASEIFMTAGYDERMPVVFDLTLNGLGGTTNLLTLAFRPPFLAATLCLILALIIIGWRAFRRFGPPIAERPAIDFGKQRLVTNGSGLILRAKRTRLLAEPYAALSARRIQRTLGLLHHDRETLDQAIAARLPEDPGFTHRATALADASRPIEILRAARALHELERTLKA
ncbi:MAG: DUF4350 domain-containing protein [Erythrobacter sp.]